MNAATPTRLSFASLSSSTVFGPATVFLAPPPTRGEGSPCRTPAHHRRCLRVLTRQHAEREQVTADDASDAGSNATLIGDAERKVKAGESSAAAHSMSNIESHILPRLNVAHVRQLEARRRQKEIHASWLHHTGLDVDDESKSGLRPHCTVEELRAGLDDFFGRPAAPRSRVEKAKQPRDDDKVKGDKRKLKLIRKVKSLHWMV